MATRNTYSPLLPAAAPSIWVMVALVGFSVASILYSMQIAVGLMAAVLGLVLLLLLTNSLLLGRVEPMVVLWVALAPLGAYFLSFPRDKPIVSFDRLSIAALMVAILFAAKKDVRPITPEMRKSALAWGAFLVAAVLSMPQAPNKLSAIRLWLDVFLLPALLGFAVIRLMDVKRAGRWVHLAICLACVYCAAIGVAEFVTDTDFFELRGGIFYHAGTSEALLPRVNGPYQTNASYALIGMISFLLLLFLRSITGSQMPPWQRAIHWIGSGTALFVALLPQFRSVMLTFSFILLIDLFVIARRTLFLRVFAIGLVAVLLTAVLAFTPAAVLESRTDASNLFQRLAQQQQTFEIFLSNPLTGIGLGNFLEFAEGVNSAANVQGLEAADSAHNNFGQVLAETGLFGAIPYLLAQIFFVQAFWRLRKPAGEAGFHVWRYFLYVFLAYWVNGMALSSGYYQDLNLFYMLATAMLYKFAISQPATTGPAQ